MSEYSPSIEKLIESFERLPSIGHKTAARLAFYILNCSEDETKEFIKSIQDAKKNLKYCSKCYNITDIDPCPICGNVKRDQSVICVVEDVRDVAAMERTHEFKGVYHVLHWCRSWRYQHRHWYYERRIPACSQGQHPHPGQRPPGHC